MKTLRNGCYVAFTIAILCFVIQPLYAQFSFIQKTDISLKINGKDLPNAWAGGINSGQFSKIQLNDDDVEDLVVFDRTSFKIKTFIASKQQNGVYFWKYDPRYEALFPSDLQHWLLLIDYDLDGRKDLFTFTAGGIRVFKNTKTVDGFEWQLVSPQLRTEGFSGTINLYVQATDLPAILDIDNDGDMDILAFDFSGNSIEFHQNMAKERKLSVPFAFKKVATCWGNVWKEHCNDFKLGQDCPTQSPTSLSNARVAHAGNSLWAGDLNGDGFKDVLFGHIACNNTAVLFNTGGNGLNANITSFSKDFPTQNPINFSIFPSVYVEDFDFDKIPDLVASPSLYDNGNQLTDFSNSAWMYKNEGTTNNPKLNFKQSDFLQADMLDLGENAAPALADIDGDDDLDLVVGYAGQRGPKGYRASFYYFKNTGSKTQPIFELVTTDFLGLSENLQFFNAKPFFADVDGNGTTDFGYWANTLNGMEIRYVSNFSPRRKPSTFDTKTILIPNPDNFSNGDNLLFYDIDKDGKTDILVGRSTGNIDFYRNNGNKYELKSASYKGIGLNFDAQSPALAIADFNNTGISQLLTADYSGTLRIYKDAEKQNSTMKPDSSLVFNNLNKKNEFSSLGKSIISAVGDLDGDRLPDLLIGTNTGGVLFLKNQSQKSNLPAQVVSDLLVYPNPATAFFYVKVPNKGIIEVFNSVGQVLKTISADSPDVEYSFDVSDWPAGIYVLRWLGDSLEHKMQKVLVR